jgi:hypothetical protein
MFAFEPDDVVEALRETTGLSPVLWHCECGCGTCLAYARDHRALWLVSGMSEDAQLHILGFETMRELVRFLDVMSQHVNRRTMNMLRPTLKKAFRAEGGKPS